MAVTLYLFDAHKAARAVVKGASELIHAEHEWALNAAIPAKYGTVPGEYLGFKCVDGKFRLFQHDTVETDDETNQQLITATDGAVAELADMVTLDVRMDSATAQQAFAALLDGTGWTLGTVTATERTGKVSAYYVETWAALQAAAKTFNARLVPYYIFENGQITGRRLDVLKKEGIFMGRIFTSGTDADGVVIIRNGSPKTVMYGAGAATGTTENPDRVTIADAVWSKAKGDPADKPAGQLWVEDEAAAAQYGRRAGSYVDQNITDANQLLQATWDELQRLKQPTVTGRANAKDMEFVQGHSHKKVRLYDLIAVRDQNGNTATAQAIGINRDYINEWLTKFDLGDEKQEPADITRQVAKANQSIEALSRGGAGGRNAAEENREFIVQDREKIQLHTVNIAQNGEQIQQTALTLQGAVADLTATQQELSYLSDNVTTVTTQLNTVQVNLDAATVELGLKASQKDLEYVQGTTEVLQEDLSAAEIRLNGAEAAIEARVEKNGVIAAINLSTEEAKIEAPKINLVGYVTASQLSAEIATLEGAWADNFATDNISAQYGYIVNPILINQTCAWHNLTMGNVASGKLMGISSGSDINLQHSHKVTANDDGTVTLGEVSSSGGSFNMADTAFYKDAVSAARSEGKADGISSVTLSAGDWTNGHVDVSASNGQMVTVNLPTFTTGESSSWSSDHTKNVYFYTPSVDSYLTYRQIDATDVYNSGYDKGYYNVTLSVGSWSDNKVVVTASNRKTVTVDATGVYEDGWSAGWGEGRNSGLEEGEEAGYENGIDYAQKHVSVTVGSAALSESGSSIQATLKVTISVAGSTVVNKNYTVRAAYSS